MEKRINLGCGMYKLPQSLGWVNIDVNPEVNPDVVCNLFEYDPGEESCDEAYAGHLLEHIENPVDILKRTHLWLKPGSKITVAVPNHTYASWIYHKHKESDGVPPEQMAFGEDSPKWQWHLNSYSECTLGLVLGAAGYKDVRRIYRTPLAVAHPAWQLIMTGKK